MKRKELKLVFLSAKTVGNVNFSKFKQFGEVKIYETTKKEETLKRVQKADIVFTNKVVIDKEIIDKSNIKIIQIMATGMNNVEVEYARKKGIIVKNVAGYSTDSVAQLTFAFVLEILNKVRYFNDYVNNEYHNSDIFTHIIDWHELSGKKWGIIGLGAIGKKVAQIATAFGCEVVYFSTTGKNNNQDYKKVELDELLKSCDIISVHAPLHDKTKNLLNKNNLSLIKKGAILLNLGRGGIVNEKELSEIIDKKGFFAGFDVFTDEPIKENNPLLRCKNVILTPHIAWASVEARERLVELAYQNIKNLLENRK